MKRFICVFLVFLLVFSTIGIAFGEEYEFDKETEKRIEKQEKSLKIYDKILKDIEKGKDKYSPYYGGSYLDKKGNLVVVISNIEDNMKSAFKKLLDSESIITVQGHYSLKELYALKDSIFAKCVSMNSGDINIVGVGLSIKQNKVKVYVEDLTVTKEQLLISKLGNDILFVNSGIDSTTATNITNGSKFTINGKKGTVGFGAYRNGVKGFVTAGHVGNMSPWDTAYYNYVNCGIVKDVSYHVGAYSDSAFIETNSNYNPTNDCTFGYEITSYSTSIVEGTFVVMLGITSSIKTGEIIDKSYDASYGIKDTFKMNFAVQGGDSGGPVFEPTSGSTGRLLGIISGTGSNYSFASKMEHIIWDLNLSSIITN